MIPIIIAFTPNYLAPVAVTLSSILRATPQEAAFEVICLVDFSPSAELRTQLGRIDGGSGRLSFRFMNLSHKLEGAYVDAKYTAAANYRLVIAEELPEYQRAIYTDCDIVHRQDISRLYHELNLEGYYMAGVAEALSDWQIQGRQRQRIPTEGYINSGFLVLNLELMRQDGLSRRFEELLRRGVYEFPDQDAINIVCRERLKLLPPVYNSIRTCFTAATRGDFLRRYSREDLRAVRRSGSIHYTGQKPWRAYSVLFEEWWRLYWRLAPELQRTLEAPRRLRLLARLFALPLVRPLVDILLHVKHLMRSR